MDTASKVLPLVVAVSGRVSSDTPLICQQSGMRGVIVEETVATDLLFLLLVDGFVVGIFGTMLTFCSL